MTNKPRQLKAVRFALLKGPRASCCLFAKIWLKPCRDQQPVSPQKRFPINRRHHIECVLNAEPEWKRTTEAVRNNQSP